MRYKAGCQYHFLLNYSKDDDGWYCEIYSYKTGQIVGYTGVHRHAENAEIEAWQFIEHMVAYGELADR